MTTTTTPTKTDQKVSMTCDACHTSFLLYVTDDPITGLIGEFGGPGAYMVAPVPLDSYGYTHGGCCYRAAVDHLHDLLKS